MRSKSVLALAVLLAFSSSARAADADTPVYKAPAYKDLSSRTTRSVVAPVRTVCDEVVEGTYVFRGRAVSGIDTYHVPQPDLDRGPWRRPFVSPFKGYVADYPDGRPAPKPMPRLLCGRGFAVDGNTIRIGRQSFRLFGIEAPSVGETCPNQRGGRWDCGVAAKRELSRRMSHGMVVCQAVDQEGDAVMSAHCEIDGRDLAAGMVRDGFVDALYRDSPEYVQREGEAVRQSRGIWEAYGPSEPSGPATVSPHGRR